MKRTLLKNVVLAAAIAITLAGATAMVAGFVEDAARIPAANTTSNVAAQTVAQAAAQECMCAGADQCQGCSCADCTEECCSEVPTCSNCADRQACALEACPIAD